MNDQRKNALATWVDACFGIPCSLLPASEDASFRKYYRLTLPTGATYIAVDSPPDKEKNHAWLQAQADLLAIGCRVPLVKFCNLREGFLIISDLGTQQYLSAYTTESYPVLIEQAIDQLLTIQQGVPSNHYQPYDETLLRQELMIFPEWYLNKYCKRTLNNAEEKQWQEIIDFIIARCVSQPKVWVHRDYHSRNLMVIADSSQPGIIDFQDAVQGAITYDIVSLLRDCYYACPKELEQQILDKVFSLWQEKLNIKASHQELQSMYEISGIQRHLKATGIFARLYIRDGKSGYLKDIPRTLQYIQNSLVHFPQLKALAAFCQVTPS